MYIFVLLILCQHYRCTSQEMFWDADVTTIAEQGSVCLTFSGPAICCGGWAKESSSFIQTFVVSLASAAGRGQHSLSLFLIPLLYFVSDIKLSEAKPLVSWKHTDLMLLYPTAQIPSAVTVDLKCMTVRRRGLFLCFQRWEWCLEEQIYSHTHIVDFRLSALDIPCHSRLRFGEMIDGSQMKLRRICCETQTRYWA